MNLFGKSLTDKLATSEQKKPTGQLAFSHDERAGADVDFLDIGGGVTGVEYTLTQVPSEEVALVNRYRELALDADIDESINEIRNEVFVFNEGKRPFELDFIPDTKIPENIRERIQEEFVETYKALDFDNRGQRWFEDWFVDSKLVFHKVIDLDKPKEGVKSVIPIDPLCIRKVRKLPRPDTNGLYDPTKVEEFYVYTPGQQRTNKISDVSTVAWSTRLHGMRIPTEAITFVDSGLYDRRTGKNVGYLYKAIAPFNQLRGMEDAMMIFRLARAPSRRAFYVDVSSLGKAQGESYVKDLMRRYGSKITYDPSTGALVNKRTVMSITEDYWLPRRDGKNTEISLIDGQDTSNILEEVNYYRNRLYIALNVPRSRFSEDSKPFNFGKGVEIDRDEYRFKKFIDRLRAQFMNVVADVLRTNLVLKGVIEPDEWSEVRADFIWKFSEDNAFVEWKESEVMNNRLATMRDASDLIGQYISSDWAARNILKMSDKDIREERAKILAEAKENAKANGDSFGGRVDIPPDAGPQGPSGGEDTTDPDLEPDGAE
jgi:hypothetical protein